MGGFNPWKPTRTPFDGSTEPATRPAGGHSTNEHHQADRSRHGQRLLTWRCSAIPIASRPTRHPLDGATVATHPALHPLPGERGVHPPTQQRTRPTIRKHHGIRESTAIPIDLQGPPGTHLTGQPWLPTQHLTPLPGGHGGPPANSTADAAHPGTHLTHPASISRNSRGRPPST
jgi:hypothetical protein